jgi:hypothetical protein
MAFPSLRLACTALAGTLAAAILAAGAGAQATDEPGVRPCTELDIPARPLVRVTCTTAHATLVIAHQSVPVLLRGTEIRVLSGDLQGSSAWVRLRVRNTTEAEQGLSAGGQELYLYLDGRRIDMATFRDDVWFGVGEAKTVTLEYALAGDQLEALRANGGRIDFGVRPWHDGFAPAPLIGVVRMRVGS